MQFLFLLPLFLSYDSSRTTAILAFSISKSWNHHHRNHIDKNDLVLVPRAASSQRLFSTPQQKEVSLDLTTSTTSNSTTNCDTQNRKPWPTTIDRFDQDDWGWVYTTVPPEAVCLPYSQIQDTEGAIPPDLSGTFYRAGPGKFERNGRRYEHVLDGDGFLASFQIRNGEAFYQGRFIETEYYLAEEKADRSLFRNVFGNKPGGAWKNAFDLTLKNVANTNVIEWGKRLFVLWEGGRPYELDPATFEPLPMKQDGPFRDLGGNGLRGVTVDNGGSIDQLLNLGRFFTAHPHVDGDTLLAFKAAQNAQTNNIEMEFVQYDREWKELRSRMYEIEKAAAPPHDFAFSPTYYGFFQNSLALNSLTFILGLKAPTQAMELQLNAPAKFHVVSRNGGKDFTVELPKYFNVHMVPRIEEDGDMLTVYHNGWDLNDREYFPNMETVPFLGSWSGDYPDFETSVPRTLLFRTVIDTKQEQLVSHEEIVPGVVMEWPMQDGEHIYFGLASNRMENLPTTGVARLHPETRRLDYWYAESKIFVGEPMPVPKRDGDGSWLLALFYDNAKKRTSLAILDSEKVEDGPVARIHLPHHVSYGLHNWWSNDE